MKTMPCSTSTVSTRYLRLPPETCNLFRPSLGLEGSSMIAGPRPYDRLFARVFGHPNRARLPSRMIFCSPSLMPGVISHDRFPRPIARFPSSPT